MKKEIVIPKESLDYKAENGYESLWKDAQGDDLPEIDREVIVIDIRGKVSYGHRPDTKGFDCKNIDTGKIEHLEPMTYGKGGWSIPSVVWWLDCELPVKEEKVMIKEQIIWIVWFFIDALLVFLCLATSGIISILCGSASLLVSFLLVPFEVWDKVRNYLRRKLWK